MLGLLTMTLRNIRLAIAGCCVLPLFAGCGYAPNVSEHSASEFSQPPVKPKVEATPSTQPPVSAPQVRASGADSWFAKLELPYEYWEIMYLEGKRIGFSQVSIQPSQTAGNSKLRLSRRIVLDVARAGQRLRQEVLIETIEDASGTLRSLTETQRSGSEHLEISGTVYSEKLKLNRRDLANSKNPAQAIPEIEVPQGAWGPFGIQQILLNRPMQPGERYEAVVFVELLHIFAKVELVAGQLEDTPIGADSLARLLPIDAIFVAGDSTMKSRNWMNASGEILKSVLLTDKRLQTFRTTRELAERIDSESLVDLVTTMSIPLADLKSDPHQSATTVYELEGKDVDPFRILSQKSNQWLRSITARNGELTVVKVRPTVPESLPSKIEIDPPTEACSASSTVIQSADPLIEKLAVELTGSASVPEKVAAKLTRGVYERIQKKNFSRVFLSAREVAQVLEGDCTEHSVLLVALLRNRHIPARVASGLLVTTINQKPSLAYHMWCEAWINQRWIPLDATTGGMIGTGHIKFLESPLDGGNPYVSLLPVMTEFSNLKIRVLSSQ